MPPRLVRLAGRGGSSALPRRLRGDAPIQGAPRAGRPDHDEGPADGGPSARPAGGALRLEDDAGRFGTPRRPFGLVGERGRVAGRDRARGRRARDAPGLRPGAPARDGTRHRERMVERRAPPESWRAKALSGRRRPECRAPPPRRRAAGEEALGRGPLVLRATAAGAAARRRPRRSRVRWSAGFGSGISGVRWTCSTRLAPRGPGRARVVRNPRSRPRRSTWPGPRPSGARTFLPTRGTGRRSRSSERSGPLSTSRPPTTGAPSS